MKRHVRKKVETSGDDWMTEESVLFFIYTPVNTTNLVSKPSTTNRPILLAIVISLPLLPFWCRICSYFVKISLFKWYC